MYVFTNIIFKTDFWGFFYFCFLYRRLYRSKIFKSFTCIFVFR